MKNQSKHEAKRTLRNNRNPFADSLRDCRSGGPMRDRRLRREKDKGHMDWKNPENWDSSEFDDDFDAEEL